MMKKIICLLLSIFLISCNQSIEINGYTLVNETKKNDYTEMEYQGNNNTILLRSSKTLSEDELDTDDNKYEILTTITINDVVITCRENCTEYENAMDVYVAKWTKGDTHYCLMSKAALSEDDILQWIQ